MTYPIDPSGIYWTGYRRLLEKTQIYSRNKESETRAQPEDVVY